MDNKTLSRRDLIALGVSALAMTLSSSQVTAQSHGSDGGHSGGRGQGGRGGSSGGHSTDGHSDGHTDGHTDDHDDSHTDDHDHADKIDQGGKGKGPKYKGGKDVSHPSERHGHSLEDRVLRKE